MYLLKLCWFFFSSDFKRTVLINSWPQSIIINELLSMISFKECINECIKKSCLSFSYNFIDRLCSFIKFPFTEELSEWTVFSENTVSILYYRTAMKSSNCLISETME